MSEKKKEKKNEKMINVDEEPTEDVKMKKVMKKKFSKKKENLDTMMFEVVDVKNSNAVTFMKYHIDDTTTISGSFTKKKIRKRTRTRASRRRKRRRQISKFLFFV